MNGIRYTVWGPWDGGCGHRHLTRNGANACQERHIDECEARGTYERPYCNDRCICEISASEDLTGYYARRMDEYQRNVAHVEAEWAAQR